MPFTFNQLIDIENETGRVMGAARTINSDLRIDLPLFILAEVRHAAQTLCAPCNGRQDEQERVVAINRLVSQLFQRP